VAQLLVLWFLVEGVCRLEVLPPFSNLQTLSAGGISVDQLKLVQHWHPQLELDGKVETQQQLSSWVDPAHTAEPAHPASASFVAGNTLCLVG